jgi:hypothetical protein
MGKAKDALPNDKDPKAITTYFKKVFPNMDFERVYASDMKKMVKWFAQLQKHQVEPTIPTEEEGEGEAEA